MLHETHLSKIHQDDIETGIPDMIRQRTVDTPISLKYKAAALLRHSCQLKWIANDYL